jgi:hypothetical protein
MNSDSSPNARDLEEACCLEPRFVLLFGYLSGA